MTATPVRTSKTAAAVAERPALSSVPRHFVEPPAALNPTVGLFLGGYALAALTIWGWFVGQWPLPLLVLIGFLALHLEGTVIHDACHNAAHPNRFWNAVMGHGAALLLGFSYPVFTRVHLQHHARGGRKLDRHHVPAADLLADAFGDVEALALDDQVALADVVDACAEPRRNATFEVGSVPRGGALGEAGDGDRDEHEQRGQEDPRRFEALENQRVHVGREHGRRLDGHRVGAHEDPVADGEGEGDAVEAH